MNKRLFSFLFALWMLFSASMALGDRVPVEKDHRYIGAMRVVNCKEYVTLREEPYKTAAALAKVPLDAVVYNCKTIREKKSFVYAEYEGHCGYILLQYLKKAPEMEPPVTSATTQKMTLDELNGNGEMILDWKDFNISVKAVREYVTEGKTRTEIMRTGCFLEGEPLWGHIETVETQNQKPMLSTFIGGTEMDPQVLICNGGFGLTMIDLLSGSEKWTVSIADCPIGDCAVTAVGDNGYMYIVGSDGNHPVAITQEGKVLWIASVADPELYDPAAIELGEDSIRIRYRSGMEDGYLIARFDYTGDLLDTEEVHE